MTKMNSSNSIVAVFTSHAEAETAVKELQHANFDMKKLSIIGRDQHTDEREEHKPSHPATQEHALAR
jgi:hypothetical protein